MQKRKNLILSVLMMFTFSVITPSAFAAKSYSSSSSKSYSSSSSKSYSSSYGSFDRSSSYTQKTKKSSNTAQTQQNKQNSSSQSTKQAANTVQTQQSKQNSSSQSTKQSSNNVQTQQSKQNSSSQSTKQAVNTVQTQQNQKTKNSVEVKREQEKVRIAKQNVALMNEKNNVKNKTSDERKKNQESYKKDLAYKNIEKTSAINYSNSRNQYYSKTNWQAPTYVTYSQSNFGMWDALFMWSILDNLNNKGYSNTYYNNMDTEAFKEWRKEANKLSLENAELKAKLDNLDKTMATMNNQPKISGYVDSSIPQSVYASMDAVVTPDLTHFKVGVGSSLGMYNKLCEEMKVIDKEIYPDMDANFECVKNNGSAGILSDIINGKIDGGFLQADTLIAFSNDLDKMNSLQANMYKEYVFLITSKDSDIEGIYDFENGTDKKLYSMGSGARFTMDSFSKMDDSYKQASEMSLKNKLPMSIDGFSIVKENKNSAVIFVCSVDCPILKSLEESELSKDLHMIPVNDWDFNNKTDDFGNLVYTFETIDSDMFPNLVPKKYGIIGDSIETISVNAIFVANHEWLEAKGESAYVMMEMIVSKMKNKIQENTF